MAIKAKITTFDLAELLVINLVRSVFNNYIIMVQEKGNNKTTTDKLSRYICTFAYICLYPTISRIITHYFGHKYRFLEFYSDTVLFIFLGLSFLFIPAVLWLIATKIFNKIHPAITTIYFSLFVIMQFIALVFILFMNALNNEELARQAEQAVNSL